MAKQSNAHPELSVSAIRSGTVIDHLESDATFKVADILGVQHEKDVVLVGANLPSDRLGRKGIIKVGNRELTPEEVNKIALIAPHATVNIIKDFKVVNKYDVEVPEEIEGIVRCFNPRCVTNQEAVVGRFRVLQSSPPVLRCLFCERIMSGGDIILK